jgi:hypothetical protein
MNILNAMHDAKFVRFNNQILETQYSPDPDGFLVDDDIVLEASADEGSLELTLDDVRDAVELAPGAYQLRSGEVLLFLNPPTIH